MLKVECYSGYRSNERPLRFSLGGRTLEISEVQDQWYSPEARYFRVISQDGNFYVLKHEESSGEWSLDAFRAARSEEQR